MLGPSTYVLSVQNGLKNLRCIADAVGPERVIGGVTAHSAMPLGPTVIKYNGGLGGMYIGRYDSQDDPRVMDLVDIFNAAGFETHMVRGDVRIPIWRKLLANVSCNAVAALTGFTGRQMQQFEPTNQLIRALAQETAEVARAQGFDFAELEQPDDFVVKTLDFVGDNKPSMLQDVEAGRRTEIANLNLAVVERGEEYGVDTPLNWMVSILIQAVEQRLLYERESRVAEASAAEPAAAGAQTATAGRRDGAPPVYDPAAATVTQAALRNGAAKAAPGGKGDR
jgi:2-dehydropantoate 2-reductase